VIAETSAKFSMIIVAMAGKSAYRGMNTYFVNAMRGAQGFYRFLIALTASLLLAWAFLKTAGAIMVITGGLVGLGMTIISHRNFNGVTGDVFGATNEVTRMACLLVMLGMIGWV
jgi:adenosylcobinamide-GDP ribazoletransferase